MTEEEEAEKIKKKLAGQRVYYEKTAKLFTPEKIAESHKEYAEFMAATIYKIARRRAKVQVLARIVDGEVIVKEYYLLPKKRTK